VEICIQIAAAAAETSAALSKQLAKRLFEMIMEEKIEFPSFVEKQKEFYFRNHLYQKKYFLKINDGFFFVK